MGLRRLKWGLVILVSTLIAGGLVLPAVNSALRKWPKLGSEFDDVDVNTGRTRQVRYLLYCKTSEKIEDSILTRMIGPSPDGVEPDWRRVFTYPTIGWRYSPHYAYHGAISQIRQVELTWQLCSFSDEAKRHMAWTILDKWQSDRSDFGAGRYISDVWDIAREKTESDPKAIISPADLTSIHNKQ
jgi:hypothetical protein